MHTIVRHRAHAGALALIALFARPASTWACGGCFHEPPDPTRPATMSQQVVTDHRMVLAVGAGRTTLWDQIQYAGNPDQFVWLLPIRDVSNVAVGVGDDAFVDAVERLSVPHVDAAVPVCDDLVSYDRERTADGNLVLVTPSDGARSGGSSRTTTVGSGGFSCGGSSSNSIMYTTTRDGAGSAQASDSVGLTSNRVANVGPYAIELVDAANETGGLGGWITRQGLEVPAGARAAVAYYTERGYDFVVARVRPGSGERRMSPIRVSWAGSSAVLPLRMIAAGVADKVGLTLMVLATGSVQIRNAEAPMVDERQLVWDARGARSNYRQRFDATLAGAGRDAWITEAALFTTIEAMIRPSGAPDGGAVPADAGFDAYVSSGDVPFDPDAGSEPSSDPWIDRSTVAQDVGTAPFLTRLRTSLMATQLDRDIEILPTVRLLTRSPAYQATRFVNVAACPSNTTSSTAAPRTSSSTSSGTPFACTPGALRCGCDVPGLFGGGNLAVWTLAGCASALRIRRCRRVRRGVRNVANEHRE